MTIRLEQIEFLLIGAGLFTAFLYLALRAVIFDTFAWILVLPVAIGMYFLAVPRRYLRMRLNTLDRIVLLYCVYGLGMALIGILFLGSSQFLSVKVLVHQYTPVIFYFITRRYTQNSVRNVSNVAKLIWILAIVFIVDFTIESYIVEVRGEGLTIPWVRTELARISNVTTTLLERFDTERVSTMLVGGKRPGFAAAAILGILLPTIYVNRPKSIGRQSAGNWGVFSLLGLAVVLALGVILFRLENKTAMLAASLVFVVGVLSLRSVKTTILMAAILAVIIVGSHERITKEIRTTFFTPHPELVATGTTPFAYIVQPQGIISTYSRADFHQLVFGAHLVTPETQNINEEQLGLYSRSELRAVAFPIFFGLGWMLIVLAGLAVTLRYSIELSRHTQFRVFGLALLGMMVVYTSDLHYPTTLTHGPIELFVIVVGSMSSLYENLRRSSKARADVSLLPDQAGATQRVPSLEPETHPG